MTGEHLVVRFPTEEMRVTAELILSGLIEIEAASPTDLLVQNDRSKIARITVDLRKGWWVLLLSSDKREVLGFGGEAECRTAFMRSCEKYPDDVVILSNGNIPQAVQRRGQIVRRFR